MEDASKPIRWIGSSLNDLRDFPNEVQREVGYALHLAQFGGKAKNAKPMEGFKGASVLKIVDDYDGETYRAVYTVKFSEAVYVLHCFQKKSKSGIATPKIELELIQSRYKFAVEEHEKWKKSQNPK